MCTAGAGAAIAPPPSLTETSEPTSEQDNDDTPIKPGNAPRGLGVAAKIMAKYGYKVSLMTLQPDWSSDHFCLSSYFIVINKHDILTQLRATPRINSNLVAHVLDKLIVWVLVIEKDINTLSPAQVGSSFIIN